MQDLEATHDVDSDADDVEVGAEEVQVTDVVSAKHSVSKGRNGAKPAARTALTSTTVELGGEDDGDDVCVQQPAATPACKGSARAAKRKRARAASAKTRLAPAGAAVTQIDLGSESSSSSSSIGHKNRRNNTVGAAAATALLSSQAPLDIDEAERLIEKAISLPTAFAARLQHEGGMVAIMAEFSVNISVLPSELDAEESIVSISGTGQAIGHASSHVELLFDTFKEEQQEAKAPG